MISNLLGFFQRALRQGQRTCRKGQAMVESLIVLLVLLAALFFFYDFAYATIARIFLNNAVARAARADAVGFNDFHRKKGFNVAMIPVAGERLVPEPTRGIQWNIPTELHYVQSYLGCLTQADAWGTLDYDGWYRLSHKVNRSPEKSTITASYSIPKTMPAKLAGLFGIQQQEGEEEVLNAKWEIENHASFYLKDD